MQVVCLNVLLENPHLQLLSQEPPLGTGSTAGLTLRRLAADAVLSVAGLAHLARPATLLGLGTCLAGGCTVTGSTKWSDGGDVALLTA